MRIGLFGFYRVGNFGDDLMALMAGAILRRAGHEPVVAGLAPDLAARHHLERVESPAELVATCDRIVLGGGGLLTGPRADAGAAAQQFADDLAALVGAAEAASKRIYAWSIGGDGEGPDAPVKPAAQRLLASPAFVGGTVRREADLPLLWAAGKRAAAYPDVILALPEVRPLLRRVPPAGESRPAGVRRHILLGLGDRPEDRWPRRWMRQFVARWPGVAVGSVALSPAEYRRDRRLWPEQGRYRIVHEQDPMALIEILEAADLVIAYRLHLGLAAWALGTPFLAFHPRPKVVGALRELGAAPGARVDRAASLLLALPGWLRGDRATRLARTGDRAQAEVAACAHLAALVEMCGDDPHLAGPRWS